MLYNGVNHFNWQVNNFSDSYIGDSSEGTTLTADTTANTMGSDTALLAGLAHDCWGFFLMFTLGNTDLTVRRQMTDIRIDPAAGVGNAGSSWSTLISNLYTNSPASTTGGNGYCYYFPLFLPAGTAIGARIQDTASGGATTKCFIRAIGQPTRPDLVKVGTKVQTIGDTAASTSGVSFTPGNDAVGSWSASMGTLTNDAWWWQVGVGTNDTSMTQSFYRIDVGVDATSKYVVIQDLTYQVVGSTELAAKQAYGANGLPIRHTPAGTDVYVRGASGGTPDSSFTAIVYAVT